MADEYVDLVCRLFDSWDADAVVMDRSSGTYADYHRVRPVHFEGKYFKCRGPLNTVRSPQGQPVFVQAGGSMRGRAFAARHADSIIAVAHGIAGMKTYREDVRRHAERFGRNPEHAKVLFLVYPILAETDDEARCCHSSSASPRCSPPNPSSHKCSVPSKNEGSHELSGRNAPRAHQDRMTETACITKLRNSSSSPISCEISAAGSRI